MKRGVLALALLLAAIVAQAQQPLRDGASIVHYAALATTDLSAAMAQQYGIRQRSDRALLLLNLQRESAPGKTSPLRGTATGIARNLLGEVQTLQFRPADASNSGDLIAEFDVSHLEFLNFEIEVRPEGALRPLTLKFQQQFFTDN
jgi:hypothetical protein